MQHLQGTGSHCQLSSSSLFFFFLIFLNFFWYNSHPLLTLVVVSLSLSEPKLVSSEFSQETVFEFPRGWLKKSNITPNLKNSLT